MTSNFDQESLELLFDAVLSLENKEECYKFFRDLCTVQELRAMSQRIYVAKLLTKNTVYSKIVEETGASTATISRVNRSLDDFGGNKGYTMVFDRLTEDE